MKSLNACSRKRRGVMATKAETSKVLKEGDKAPAFRVTADDGEKVSLGEYRGKNVILFFYPKANTPG